ncbi:unnamed protein product [Urochloa humidicola]
MERGLRDLKIKEASAVSERVDNPKGNDEVLATKATLAGAEKTTNSGASEVGKILKLKKEAMLLLKPAAEDTKSPVRASKKKKIMKQRLPKEFLDFLVAKPYKPLGDLSQERLAELSPEFRKWYATEKAAADKFLEYQQALINQYLTDGYAEDEFEVSEDEEEAN